MTRGTRLYFNWDTIGSDSISDWRVTITDIETGRKAGRSKLKMKNDRPSVAVDKLKPHTKYEISVTPISKTDEGEGSVFSAWTSPRAVEKVVTVGRFASTVWIEWQPPS